MKTEDHPSHGVKSHRNHISASCDASAPHQYLIGVTIHKANYLKLQNANTFIEVSLDQQWTKHTTTVENADSPFFNDYFVFELHEPLALVLKRTIRVAAFRRTCCAKRNECVGEFRMDVQTVWLMSDHAFHKKWVQLNQCTEPNESIGFVQMDACVLTKGSRPSPATLIIKDFENIEENLLIPSMHRSATTLKIKFCINIFSASLLETKRSYVRVHFAGRARETRKLNASKHPMWNEKLVFLGSWPSMCQSILFEIMTSDMFSWTSLCTASVRLDDMSFSFETPNPSFGPTYIHFYHPINSRIYLGKILIQVNLDEYLEEGNQNYQPVMSIPHIIESEYWKMNTFRVSMRLFGAYHVNSSGAKIKVRIRWAHRMSKEKMYLLRTNRDLESSRTYIMDLPSVETLAIEMTHPDVRGKFQFDQEIYKFIEESAQMLQKIYQLTNDLVEQCKPLENAMRQISSRVVDIFEKIPIKIFPVDFTNWDRNRCSQLKDILSIFKTHLETSIKFLTKKNLKANEVKIAYNETITILNSLRAQVSSHVQNNWPDIILEFLIGDKPISCHHTCEYLCGCLFAVADLSFSIADTSEQLAPDQNKPVSASEPFYIANIFLHQALIKIEVADKFFAINRPVSVLFSMKSQAVCSSAVETGIVPTWNEKLQLSVQAPTDSLPPVILIELLNIKDSRFSSDHHIGRALVSPIVFGIDEISLDQDVDQIDENENSTQKNGMVPPRWIRLYKDGEFTAEILLSIMMQIDESAPDPTIVSRIPPSLCPAMRKFKIDVTFVGLRNWAQIPVRSLGKFKIQIALGDVLLTSGPSSKPYGHSFNLLDPLKSGYVNLPVNFEYWPSMVITHIDCSGKKEVVVGIATVSTADRYYVKELQMSTVSKKKQLQDTQVTIDPDEQQPLLPVEEATKRIKCIKERCRKLKNNVMTRTHRVVAPIESPSRPQLEQTSRKHTWWTKFYNSFNYSNGSLQAAYKHSLRVYDSELESQTEFGNFRDWADCVHLTKRSGDSKESYADVKLNVQIRQCSESIEMYSLIKAQQLLDLITERPVAVCIYVVQGINLRPQDGVGNSDAYIQVHYGGEMITDRKHFIPNDKNPIFGKRYQIRGSLPKDLMLSISVYDRDSVLAMKGDDLIGTTTIDLEDRLRSRHRAFAGIANEYSQSGYNRWRWSETPSQILQNLCSKHGLPLPVLVGRRLQVGDQTFADSTTLSKDEPLIERLSLSVLKELHSLPAIGYSLVPEHVETRSLYRSDQPGVEQGKLQLWIEINESSRINSSHQHQNLLDITPTPPARYELRVTVWNTKDVVLDDTNVFGKRMSDIYVKGWLDNVQDAQNTDVHYRSFTGEGQFNWRFVFPLLYAEAEDMLVVTRTKGFFESQDTLLKKPACLHIQVWDNDAISSDDFLGSASILLSSFEMPAAKANKCRLNERTSSSKELLNLFALPSSVRGWFPIKGQLAGGKMGQTGKVELELEVKLSSMCFAVGLGREGPQALPAPNRPETSFNWFSNPLRSIKLILLPQLKRLCRWICLGLLVVCGLILLVYFIASQALGAARPSAETYSQSKNARCAKSGLC